MRTTNTLSLNTAAISQTIQVILQGDNAVESIHCLGPTCIALRQKGRRLKTAWCYSQNLVETLEYIKLQLQNENSPSLTSDALEICLTHHYRQVPLAQFNQVFANLYRGIRGIELQYQDQVVRYSPTQMIAANLSFRKALERFLEQISLTLQTFAQKGGIIQVFEARQVLVQLQPQITVTSLHRGNRVFPLSALSIDEVQKMTTTMGHWMLRQLSDDGRLVYKYFPSRGQESTGNNLIRQFMATLCLIRYAVHTQQSNHQVLASFNLAHNLKQFYRKEGDLGFVEYDGKVKLGAVALAALGLLEAAGLGAADAKGKSPLAALLASKYGELFKTLWRTVETLWQSDGSFRTFLKPTNRNDNQNFYPGEALLFWSSLYPHSRDPQLLERCYKSFAYYRNWHRQHRNPAFIPWHTQAYAKLYACTGDRQFLDFIFEMNDWLLPMQQLRGTAQADLLGRFYDPYHPEYGPPHASSTGVYLEGLAAAYDLAHQVGDTTRAQNYETAIWWGIRSLRQLQFRDATDLYYISRPEAVHGGLRTTVYDNVIRIDNVQHGMMALMTLLDHPKFFQSSPPSASTAGQAAKPAPIQATTAEDAQTLKEFRLINPQVNIQPLLEEVAAQGNLWLHDTSRQEKIAVQRETNTIYLRSAVKPFPPGVTNGNDVHPSHLTKMADKFPVTLQWLENFARDLGAELGRATLVRLAPRGRVYRHIDHGEYYRRHDRYHLVLQSPTGSLLGAGDEWVRMFPGECWWFNNKAPHEAHNGADDWRIHLIFDLLNPVSTGWDQVQPQG